MDTAAAWVPSRDLARVHSAADVVAGVAALRTAYGLDEGTERWIRVSLDGAGAGDAAAEAADTDADTDADADAVDDTPPADDAFETHYVQTWLRGAIAWSCRHAPEHVDACAELLVHLAGQSAAGARQCTYRFFARAAHADDAVATVHIRDIALTDDALGGRTWGAAPYLARRLLQHYAAHAPTAVLELGAGTGLAGLALHAFVRTQHGRAPRTVLTDHHAVVLHNLAHNAAANADTTCTVAHLDWQHVYEQEAGTSSAYTSTAQTVPAANDAAVRAFAAVPRDARFDVLIAADCIYDVAHAAWIAAVTRRHLAHTGTPTPALHLLVPVRPTHTAELQAVYDVLGAAPLRIVRDTPVVGTDDFGPATMRARTARALHGRRVAFRHLVVAWA
ncbi:hypothetical protein MBRA1_003370 [Malassezia brasiliensis]|uniref:Uncharacterized protein n=1 Tax=Malassezia brasiliensis TaxID=1821822 RepID=A0AAF0IPV2_9BASI|nr:hypothetical protein MBRA1_003370 [Malassezia brasiliensis]